MDLSSRRPGMPSSSTVPLTGSPPQYGQAGRSASHQVAESSRPADKGRKKRRKKKRRQSFVALDPPPAVGNGQAGRDVFSSQEGQHQRQQFYRAAASGRNLSDESLESGALLDHRDQAPMRIRRDSHVTFGETRSTHRPGYTNPFVSGDGVGGRRHSVIRSEEDDDATPTDDRTPLLRASPSQPSPSTHGREYGGMYGASSRRAISAYTGRSGSVGSGHSGQRRPRAAAHRENSNSLLPQPTYDVNNPPSMPPSPILGPQNGVDDGFDPDAFPGPGLDRRPTGSRAGADGEHLVDIDGDGESAWQRVSDAIAARMPPMAAEDDVCFPVEGMSELGEEDFLGAPGTYGPNGPSVEIATGRRKRTRRWPDLGVLEEWSREERAERSEEIRAKKISEPVLVGGRLRPQKQGWHREEADAPFRFTYFNEEFPSTIHSQTISELLQPGQSFRELFVPDPPELSDESSNGEEDLMSQGVAAPPTASADAGLDSSSSRGATTRESSNREDGRTREPSNRTESRTADTSTTSPRTQSASQSPPNEKAPASAKPKRYGARPTFWLDVLSPTEVEMRVIQKTFGIHPLTAEDILMQEAREKVELFRNYYFVNYRTFEQDQGNDDYLEPVDMYVVVFREGVISFHFSMTPHPANVRRRIRQLKDYLVLTADWISYAIIDDITDVFQPLIASIEKEVDDIDDVILQMHGSTTTVTNENSRGGGGNGSKTGNGTSIRKGATADDEKHSTKSEMAAGSGGDMLRRVGEGRKKVMGLYRLLGNKADVIKGFAKRCNEQWEIAPRSEIGLYLGDIQDHILTMTSNLSHYETLLSRAHSNYLAQINIRMNERQEQTADVLGKLTVLGTIVLPLNVVTGLWGMNVMVPGQEVPTLTWFWAITAGLFAFGLSCFFIAKRMYGIV